MDEIQFYRANEKPYGAFSNLYKRPVVFEGDKYQTSDMHIKREKQGKRK